MDCALAKAARESRAKNRIPTMVTKTDRKGRIRGVNEWLWAPKNQETARPDTRWFELEMVSGYGSTKPQRSSARGKYRRGVCWVFATIQMGTCCRGE